jgi:hypothetical protein
LRDDLGEMFFIFNLGCGPIREAPRAEVFDYFLGYQNTYLI